MSIDVLIVGCGVFGLSTAYHLAKRGGYRVTCVDKYPVPSLDSAAYDINKIVRTEYDDPLYTLLAIEALQAWREPMWAEIFHETGWLTATSGNPASNKFLADAYENLQASGQAKAAALVEGRDQICEYVPHLAKATGIERWRALWNGQAGWAHSSNALRKLAGAARDLGVDFVFGPDGTIVGLETESGKVGGIKTASGKIHTASQYIFSTGAGTALLFPELASQLRPTCWSLAHLKLNEQEIADLKGMPVVDNHELGYFFEPNPETGLFKICNATQGYQWCVGKHEQPNGDKSQYSVPRYASEHPDDGIPAEAEEAIHRLIDQVLPQFSGRSLYGKRLCWDLETPDQHFLVSKHPAFPHGEVVLATGGSAHAFKFLPVIGRYVADAVEGKATALRDEWSWRQREAKLDPTYPAEEVKDLRDLGIGL